MSNEMSIDLAILSKELRLLLLLLEADNHETVFEVYKDLFADIDWDLFLQLSFHHRIYPSVYLALKKIDPVMIPEHVMEKLAKNYRTNVFQMLYLSREMDQICKLFEENGIRMIVLKGPVLAADLYGDISLRTSRDLDILISVDDLEKADKLVRGIDYTTDMVISTVIGEWKWRGYHHSYSHAQKGIILEIHWRMNPGPGKEPSFDELWERKRKSSYTSYPAYYLGREDTFMFLVTHGARHGWSRLRWLADIDRLVKQEIDSDKLKRLLKKYQCLHTGGLALILASQLLNTPATEGIKTLLEIKSSRILAQDTLFYLKQMVNVHAKPLPEDVARHYGRYLFAIKSPQQKFLFIMSLFYPYALDADTIHLPRHLHFLYFPLRPITWAWRKLKTIF